MGAYKAKGETGPNDRGNLGRRFDAERKRAFLDILALTGRPAQAAQKIGVALRTVESHRSRRSQQYDEEFAIAYDESMELYREILQEAIHRRGVEGVEEPVFYKGRPATDAEGNPVGIRKFSDAMLALHAKRHDPAYRDRQIIEQHSTNVNAALEDLSKLSPESRRKLREILEDEGGSTSDVP